MVAAAPGTGYLDRAVALLHDGKKEDARVAAAEAALHSTGAVAVDMESAATLRTAVRHGVRPVAAVRVIVDAPEHELVRIGTVRGGISAFRVLRAVLPAFYDWHRSLLLPRR